MKPAPTAGAETVRIPKALRLEWVDLLAVDRQLSHTQFRVACIIGRHFNKITGDTFIGQETLARMMGVSKRTVWTAIKGLEDRGYLIVKRRELGIRRDGRRVCGGRGVANTYSPAIERSPVTNGAKKLAKRCDDFHEKRSQFDAPKVAADNDPTLSSPTGKNPARARAACAAGVLGPPGERLRQRLGDKVFWSWFGRVHLVGVTDKSVHMAAPTRFIASHITNNFEHDIVSCWQREHPSIRYVKVTVATDQSAEPRPDTAPNGDPQAGGENPKVGNDNTKPPPVTASSPISQPQSSPQAGKPHKWRKKAAI